MLFNSYSFLLVYLPIVLTGFFILCKRHLILGAKIWLLLSSLFFYGFWDVRFLPLLVGSILFNYGCGVRILNSKDLWTRKAWLIVGIVGDLSLLFYFKYCNFFISTLLSNPDNFLEIALPLGISFFTFTQIAFLIDAYKNKADKCDIISYGLFVTIFPHLIAGPILHNKEMIKQFNSLRLYIVQWPNISQGIFLFIWGLSKKVLIADPISEHVKPIFDNNIESITFIHAWFGAIAYTLQLYFDFSGYSDMAVGLGLLFNLHLPINFNAPYKADSIIDFWRRWHITLSAFLKDYLYISLGGNRHGKFKQLQNLFLTMFLGGLWHGAGWTFILWGACHGSFLIINHLWRDLKTPLPNFLAKTLTLLAVIFAWVIFRSSDLATAQNIIKGMLGFNGLLVPEKFAFIFKFLHPSWLQVGTFPKSNFHLIEIVWVGLLFIGVLFFPNSDYWKNKFQQRPAAWAFPCAAILVIDLLNLSEVSEFLYYQF